MFACKVMIKAPLEQAKARFEGYEDMEFFQKGDWVLAEDFSGTQLFGWEVSTWLELAGKDELIYAYYDENMNAEFVFIQNGLCMRAYQEYDGEVDTDQGEDLDVSISGWSDVAEYMDEHMV